MNTLQAKIKGDKTAWASPLFRVARLFLLVLLVIMPWEAVTAGREMAMMGAALFLAAHLWLSPKRNLRATVLFWPLVFYILTAVLSLFSAVDFSYSLSEIRAEILKGLIVFYTGAHFVHDYRHLRQAWGALLVGVGLMTVAGLVLFFLRGGSPLAHFVRAGSLHNGYGGLGTYMSLVWPFLLLAPLAFGSRGLKSLWLALIPLTAFLAYLTFNRAAWLAMLLETGLCLLALSRHRLRAAALVLALCLALAAGLTALPGATHGERWSKLWERPQEVGGTAGDLMVLWRHSLQEISKHPFTGIGLGRHSFSLAYPEFRATHPPLLWHAHNMFLDISLQLGLQGLLAVLAIMAVLVAALWPRAVLTSGEAVSAFGAAAAIMVVGFCVRNLADDFFVKDSALLFWLLAGLALGAGCWRKEAVWDEAGS